MSGEEQVPDDYRGPMEAIVHARDVGQQREGENGLPNSDEFVIPDGEQYSLCSKRLKASRIQQIAEALDLSTGNSTAETRQMIQEKLGEMGCEPSDVQIIIQGRGDDAQMFLVNDTGIIKTIECSRVASHVHDEISSEVDSRSALRGARHIEREPEGDRSGEIEQLRLDLQSALARADQERAITAQKEE